MGGSSAQQIVALARENRLAEVVYRKALTDRSPGTRKVEFYSLTQGREDVMLRAYQVSYRPGWKFFMLHRLVEVKDAGRPFVPRRPVTASLEELRRVYEPWARWDDAVREYRDLVLAALADMTVTREEARALARFRKDRAVSDEMMRSVHASVFSNCLAHILDDGVVDDAEREEIRHLHVCFGRLGWAVGD